MGRQNARSRHRLCVLIGESAADIERVEGTEFAASLSLIRPTQVRIASTCFAGIRGLRSDVERQPRTRDSQLARPAQRARARPWDRNRIFATGRRPHRDCGTTRAAAATRGAGIFRTWRFHRHLQPRRYRTPKSSALRISLSRLIGWVWMQRSALIPSSLTSRSLPWWRDLNARQAPPASCTTACMRQRLQRVVQDHARQGGS